MNFLKKKTIRQLIIRLFLFATAIREHCQLPKSTIAHAPGYTYSLVSAMT